MYEKVVSEGSVTRTTVLTPSAFGIECGVLSLYLILFPMNIYVYFFQWFKLFDRVLLLNFLLHS